MKSIGKPQHAKFWKYDLRQESLAAAGSGMFPVTGLDERCIVFTIHLNDEACHALLCRTLFDTTEAFFERTGAKRRSASYSGLASFLDVNGSKFTGADRDFSKAHCHGFLLIPHNVSGEDVEQLISLLLGTVMRTTTDGQSVVKGASGAVEFMVFDRSRPGTSLENWIGYAQKEAVRVETTGQVGVFLPFDCRHEYGHPTAIQVSRKRDKLLAMLTGPDRFKIFRGPKPAAC